MLRFNQQAYRGLPQLGSSRSLLSLPARKPCLSRAFSRPEDAWADRRAPGEPEIEDVFETAAARLQSLLDAEEGPQFNMAVNLDALSEAQKQAQVERISWKLGGCFAMTVLGAIICLLLEQPLWGNQSFGWKDQAAHAFCGAALIGPLAILKWISWKSEVQEEIPSISCYHDLYKGELAKEIKGLDETQVSALFLAESIARTSTRILVLQTVLLVPLILGYQKTQELGWAVPHYGWTLPDSFPAVTAVLLTALVNAGIHYWQFAPSQAQVAAVQHGIEKSENYFGVLKHSKGKKYDDPARLSETFQLMASAWISNSIESAILTSGLAAIEVLLISGLWQGTHDIWAALPAALLMFGADLFGAFKQIREEQN